MAALSTADLTDGIPDLPSERAALESARGAEPESPPSTALADVAEAITTVAEANQSNNNLRAGQIVAITEGRLTITLGGEPTEIENVPYIDSVAPFVGAKIWALQFGDQLLVVGVQGANRGGGGLPGEIFYHWSDSETLPGAILCYGQTITDADTTYPGLWAYAPASSKSGTSLTVPDLRGRTIFGRDNMGGADAGRIGTSNTVGATGGSNTISTSNLPSHSHSFTTGSSGTHSHSYSGSASGSVSISGSTNHTGDHSHVLGNNIAFAYPSSIGLVPGGANPFTGSSGLVSNAAGGHSHSFSGSGSLSGGSSSGSTNSTGSHTHSGSTDSVGSGAEFLPPHIILNGYMRV